MVIYKSCKIEIKKSTIHGFGVFAKENIKEGELLEECHYAKGHIAGDILDYAYNWPRNAKDYKYTTIPFGFACVYNCAKSVEKRSVNWDCDEERDLYVFKATKNVTAGEELLSYYGPQYWIAHEKRKQIKKDIANGIYTNNV